MQKNQNAPNTNNVLTIVLVFSRIQINAFRVGCELVHFITFYIIFCNLIICTMRYKKRLGSVIHSNKKLGSESW